MSIAKRNPQVIKVSNSNRFAGYSISRSGLGWCRLSVFGWWLSNRPAHVRWLYSKAGKVAIFHNLGW